MTFKFSLHGEADIHEDGERENVEKLTSVLVRGAVVETFLALLKSYSCVEDETRSLINVQREFVDLPYRPK